MHAIAFALLVPAIAAADPDSRRARQTRV